MSELQDKLDRGEISPKEYFDAWEAEMEEKERLHPGFHDRWHGYLMTRYPGHGMDSDAFFDSEQPDRVCRLETKSRDLQS